jgi:hypothetical protein
MKGLQGGTTEKFLSTAFCKDINIDYCWNHWTCPTHYPNELVEVGSVVALGNQ